MRLLIRQHRSENIWEIEVSPEVIIAEVKARYAKISNRTSEQRFELLWTNMILQNPDLVRQHNFGKNVVVWYLEYITGKGVL